MKKKWIWLLAPLCLVLLGSFLIPFWKEKNSLERVPSAEFFVGAGITITGNYLGKKALQWGVKKYAKHRFGKFLAKGKKGSQGLMESAERFKALNEGDGLVKGLEEAVLTNEGFEKDLQGLRDHIASPEVSKRLEKKGVQVKVLIDFLDEKIAKGEKNISDNDLREVDRRHIEKKDSSEDSQKI